MKILDNSETKHYLKLCEEMGEEADVLQLSIYVLPSRRSHNTDMERLG